MLRNRCIDLHAVLDQAIRDRDEAQAEVVVLRAKLIASEEGRKKLWSMIKIFTESAQQGGK